MVVFAEWMKKGALVSVFDKHGVITRVETARVDGIKNAKFIYVMLAGGRFSNPYYPADVKPIKK